MTAVPLDTTPTLCVLCPPARARVARPGGMTDWDCHDRLREQLTEVVERYVKLSALPGGGQAPGRRAPGYGSKPPLNLHVAALRDPRTRPLELGEPHSAVNLFGTWANWLRETRGQLAPPPPSVAVREADIALLLVERTYLLNSLDWITRQEWVPTFAGQLRVVVRQLRAATGEPNPRPCGWCTVVYPDGSECRHPLFPPTDGREIGCGACGATYDPLAQVRLKKANSTAGLTASAEAICRVCGHASGQHDNDHDPRPCNSRWCTCANYEPEDLTA